MGDRPGEAECDRGEFEKLLKRKRKVEFEKCNVLRQRRRKRSGYVLLSVQQRKTKIKRERGRKESERSEPRLKARRGRAPGRKEREKWRKVKGKKYEKKGGKREQKGGNGRKGKERKREKGKKRVGAKRAKVGGPSGVGKFGECSSEASGGEWSRVGLRAKTGASLDGLGTKKHQHKPVPSFSKFSTVDWSTLSLFHFLAMPFLGEF